MSDLQQELEAVRREVAELRAAVQNIEGRQGSNDVVVRKLFGMPAGMPMEKEEPWTNMSRRMTADMEKRGKPASIGVQRNVVFKWRRNPDDSATFGWEAVIDDVNKLPTEQKLVELGAVLSNPLSMRTIYMLIRHHLEGHEMRMDKMELAAALGVSAAELEQGLNALIARDILRSGRNEDGKEFYRLEQADVAAVLLTLA